MKATRDAETGNWFVVGFSGRKYWGATGRDAEQNAALYFYK